MIAHVFPCCLKRLSGNFLQYDIIDRMEVLLHFLDCRISSSVIHRPKISVSRLSILSLIKRHFAEKSAWWNQTMGTGKVVVLMVKQCLLYR